MKTTLTRIAFLFTLAVAAHAAPFQNGSFEINAGNITGVMTAAGWTITSGPPVRFLNDQGSTDAAFAALFNPGSGQNGSVLSQTFDTVAGQLYRVTFDWGNHGSDAIQRLKVEVRDPITGEELITVGGGTLKTVGGAGVVIDQNTNVFMISDSTGNSGLTVFAPAPNIEFSTFNFIFSAQSASAKLSFTDQGTGDLSSSDGILDNVRVVPVPITATAIAQVVNGFVVGATVTDGGYGYTNSPTVIITGGGGSGAKAFATINSNGVVTSITITNPGIGYTSDPVFAISSPPFPPRKAKAISEIINGFVVGIKITDSGFGYVDPPVVMLTGAGGSGATATATVVDGIVTGITVTAPGTGYTSAPKVFIASPPFSPELSIEVTRVRVNLKVVLGRKYQIQSSQDLTIWSVTGPPFIAQEEELAQDFDVDAVGRFFRINQVP